MRGTVDQPPAARHERDETTSYAVPHDLSGFSPEVGSGDENSNWPRICGDEPRGSFDAGSERKTYVVFTPDCALLRGAPVMTTTARHPDATTRVALAARLPRRWRRRRIGIT